MKEKFDKLHEPSHDKAKRYRNSVADVLANMPQIYKDVRTARRTNIENAQSSARRRAEECMELKTKFTKEIEKIEKTTR